jgi:hypothetical protein
MDSNCSKIEKSNLAWIVWVWYAFLAEGASDSMNSLLEVYLIKTYER